MLVWQAWQVRDSDVSGLLENMGGKRRAPTSGDAQGKAAVSWDAAAAHGGGVAEAADAGAERG